MTAAFLGNARKTAQLQQLCSGNNDILEQFDQQTTGHQAKLPLPSKD